MSLLSASTSAVPAVPLVPLVPPAPRPLAAPRPVLAPQALEALHPALWRAHQLSRPGGVVWPSGFAALDAQLPGGGWPQSALCELLLAQSGIGEWRLLAPVLADVAAKGRLLMLFHPPAQLSVPALAGLGLQARQFLLVQGRAMASSDMLWALEQSLKCGHVGAVLAWLPPRVPSDALRRLQLAVAAHEGPAFLLREWAAQQRPSPAPLRLSLQASGPDGLAVQLLKRRGPTHAQTLLLDLPPVLRAAQRARALVPRLRPQAAPLKASRPEVQAGAEVQAQALVQALASVPGLA